MCAAADAPSFRFQTNDVIAFVGGEDVVEMQRNGYLELLLTAALPHHKLRFRNLAFEGDTVFEQHRQLNFPTWEKQLERVGATVVIAQFGQAESLQGTNGLAQFVGAYEKLLDRFTSAERRIVLLTPTRFSLRKRGPSVDLSHHNSELALYAEAINRLAERRSDSCLDLFSHVQGKRVQNMAELTRDGLHLSARGHCAVAEFVVQRLCPSWSPLSRARLNMGTGVAMDSGVERLRQAILAKNRLWFDYWRPQNWAFLHGDRTEQPSSRDHRDLKKRWFPEEMEKFLPLIEAKEKEIWEAAKKL